MKRIRNILGLLFIAVIAVFLYLIFRKDQTHTTTELRTMFETEYSNYHTWRERQIHYVDQGKGPAVLFVHGFGGSFANWNTAMELIPYQYRCIAVDLPGFGLSDAPVYSDDERIVDMSVDMIHHLITELELDSVTLVGNSMGGYISWETAFQHPNQIEKLILVDAAGYDLDEIGGTLIKLSGTKFFDWITRKGIPYRLSLIAARNSVAQKPDKERVKRFHHLMNRKETLETVATIGSSGEIADTNRIPLISQPTLIIWGEADHVIEVDHAHRFDRDIPNSEVIIYPLIGHVPMIENPELFLEDVVGFLEE